MTSAFLLWQPAHRSRRAGAVILGWDFPVQFLVRALVDTHTRLDPRRAEMKHRTLRPAWLVALALLPVQVAADPIQVTSGFHSITGLGSNGVFEFKAPGFEA